MNNTLTGLGLALVLALLAALIGPYFVNWTAYRDDFASQVSALVGAPVTVSGAVDVRLLPSPYVRFRDLTAADGPARLTVREIEISLGLGPLMRGEFKADRVKVVEPKLALAVLPDGTVRTPFARQGIGAGEADRISFDRAEIVGGEVSATTAGGHHLALSGVDGIAEAGSLRGPYRFEGTASWSGRTARVRASTARMDAGGALRTKLTVAPEGRPETLDLDGALTVAARPAFDGFAVAVRPAPREKTAGTDADFALPWRIAGKLKIDTRRAALDDLDVSYGPDDRALRVTGSGGAEFGQNPKWRLALDTRQIDLDRFLGASRPKSPAGVVAAIAPQLGALAHPAIDGKLSIGVRGLVAAGDVVRDLRAEIAAENDGWRIEKASASLPGDASASLAGALVFADSAPGFAGHVDFASSDLAGFRRWVAGADAISGATIRKVALKGDVVARSDAVSLDHAEISADGASTVGRVAWRAKDGAEPARLEAALTSDRLDLDALGLARLIPDALSHGDGSEAFVSLDASTLVYGGVDMKGVSVDGAVDARGVELKQLSIADAAGAKISGSGTIAAGDSGPEGRLAFRVEAGDIAPLVALARAAGAPEGVTAAIETREQALAPVRLDVALASGKDGRSLTAKGEAAGGAADVTISAKNVSPDADAAIDAVLSSQDGRRLAKLFGIDLSPVAEGKGGDVSIHLKGAPSRGMVGEGRFAALGLELVGRGTAAIAPEAGLSAEGDVTLKSDDLSRLLEGVGRLAPGASPALPVSLSGKARIDAEKLELQAFAGEFMGDTVSGAVAAPFDPQKGFDGKIEVDAFPLATFAALALSPSATATPAFDRRSAWPAGALGPSPVRGLTGRLDVRAGRIPLTSGSTVKDASFALALRPNSVTLDNLAGALDGGRLTGSLAVARNGDDASVNVVAKLEGARAEQALSLVPGASGVSGGLDLQLEAQGGGRTIAAIVASLNGAGSVTLTDGALRGLDTTALDAVEPEIEKGLALDAGKIGASIDGKLGRSDLVFRRLSSPFTLSGGVVRSSGLGADSATAKMGGVVAADLNRLTLDADLTLAPNRDDAPQIGVFLDGPLATPKRRIDATSMTSWLSVRAVERETRRIEAMEADARERARIAREKADAERKKAEEDRQKAEEERKRREAEAKALIDSLPQPAPNASPALPSTIDISPAATTKPPVGLSPAKPRSALTDPTTRTQPSLLPPPTLMTPPSQ